MCWVFFDVEDLCSWLALKNDERILKGRLVNSGEQMTDDPLHNEHNGDCNHSVSELLAVKTLIYCFWSIWLISFDFIVKK